MNFIIKLQVIIVFKLLGTLSTVLRMLLRIAPTPEMLLPFPLLSILLVFLNLLAFNLTYKLLIDYEVFELCQDLLTC